MQKVHWRLLSVAALLVALTLISAQCTKEKEKAASDTALAVLASITPSPSPSPSPRLSATPVTKVSFIDDLNDVIRYGTDQIVTEGVAAIDIGSADFELDPATGTVSVSVTFPETDDLAGTVRNNPYWAFILFGDSLEGGTPPLSEYQFFGLGQYHLGCFNMPGGVECEMYLRVENEFVLNEVDIEAELDGSILRLIFPEGFPRQNDRFGIAVQDATHFDTLGIEDGIIGTLRTTFEF